MNKLFALTVLLSLAFSTSFAQAKRKTTTKKITTTPKKNTPHTKKSIVKKVPSKKTILNKKTTNLNANYFVETMAEYNGGEGKLYEFLNANLSYPQIAIEQSTEGTVRIEFQVCTDGKLCDLKIVRGVSKELNDEALRVVSKMGNWKPATLNGKAINTYYTLPITFQLTSN